MKGLAPALEVVAAEGVLLRLADGRQLIDAVSSWWSVIHGYSHPELNRAAGEQLERFAHVMLGGLTHKPVQALADKLVQITPPGLNHVFFADSGSVGIEVALKMVMQFWQNQQQPKKNKILALKHAYHGDTCGAMSVSDPDEEMHRLFSGLLRQHLFVEAPASGLHPAPDALRLDIKKLETCLKQNHRELAALIVEPLMQAAGGFNFYSPKYLEAARKCCDDLDVLLIFDEVATGFGRTGSLFAADQARVTPDIMVLGKALTAGYFGHSATLATTKVFNTFLGDDDRTALMHGPTFMANATACAVALKSIEIFERENYLDKIEHIENVLRENLLPLSSDKIQEVCVLGGTGVVEVRQKEDLASIQRFAANRGVWLRPFGRYVYTMPPYIISEDELLAVTGVIKQWFQKD